MDAEVEDQAGARFAGLCRGEVGRDCSAGGLERRCCCLAAALWAFCVYLALSDSSNCCCSSCRIALKRGPARRGSNKW